MTLFECLRSESIHNAALSDMCDLVYHQRVERFPYQILIMRIGKGKNVYHKTIFGRVMRHIDVRKCLITALKLSLLVRFRETNEINEYDCSKNHTCCNSKLMISRTSQKINRYRFKVQEMAFCSYDESFAILE